MIVFKCIYCSFVYNYCYFNFEIITGFVSEATNETKKKVQTFFFKVC